MLKKGEHLVIQRSYWGCFRDVLHGRMGNDGKIRVVSYKPISPKKGRCGPCCLLEKRFEATDVELARLLRLVYERC